MIRFPQGGHNSLSHCGQRKTTAQLEASDLTVDIGGIMHGNMAVQSQLPAYQQEDPSVGSTPGGSGQAMTGGQWGVRTKGLTGKQRVVTSWGGTSIQGAWGQGGATVKPGPGRHPSDAGSIHGMGYNSQEMKSS